MNRFTRLAILLGGGALCARLASAQEVYTFPSDSGAVKQSTIPSDTGVTVIPAPTAIPAPPAATANAAPVAADSLAPYRERLSDVNLSSASDRVGFSGFLYTRGYGNRYLDMPDYLWPDAARNSMDANFTLKVGVNASSFIKAWSMVSFGYDFGGHFQNDKAFLHPRTVTLPGAGSLPDTVAGDMSRAPYLQDKNREAGRIFEDLSAGLDIRTDPADANIRAGSAMWVEGSPFTIWRRDPRPILAWYYEGYEPEQSSYQYYTQKFFYRQNNLGRLSWPKRPFGGMEMDAFRLPWDMGLQVDFAQPTNMLPTKTDGNTYNAPGDAEALGSINSLGQMYYGRLTKKTVFAGLTAGLNVLWVQLPDDIINQTVYSTTSTTTQGFRYQFRQGGPMPFYTDPRVFSLDARGKLNPTTFIHADLALAFEDTVQFHPPDSLANDTNWIKAANGGLYNGTFPVRHAQSRVNPAAYVKLNTSGTLPIEAEAFYAAKKFWSPYAMTEYAVPVHRDEIKLGTGSFSYEPNLVGLSVKVSPKLPSGFFNFTIGQHVQAEKGKDMIRFQHVLNGRDVWNASSSWSRTEPGRLLDEGVPYFNARYESRLGEGQRNFNPLYLQAQPGGLRGDDQELWEEFAAYDNVAQANAGIVPESRKYAASLAADYGHDVGPMVGYSRTLMVAMYGSVNSIAKDLSGPLDSKQTLLWSALGRLEAVISIAPTFQIIGLLGTETWRSDKTYRNFLYNKQNTNSDANNKQTFSAPVTPAGDTLKNPDGTVIIYNNILSYEPIMSVTRAGDQRANPLVVAIASPIDYLQMAYGVGFDWDFTSRAGLHVRYKFATHADKNLPDNDWKGSFFFAETKLWF